MLTLLYAYTCDAEPHADRAGVRLDRLQVAHLLDQLVAPHDV